MGHQHVGMLLVVCEEEIRRVSLNATQTKSRLGSDGLPCHLLESERIHPYENAFTREPNAALLRPCFIDDNCITLRPLFPPRCNVRPLSSEMTPPESFLERLRLPKRWLKVDAITKQRWLIKAIHISADVKSLSWPLIPSPSLVSPPAL